MKISNDKLMEILERNLGLPMGDGGVYYIQDPGQKRINKIYFSKDDMLLYKCTADTTDVTVTGNFKVYSLTNSDDYIEGLTGIGRGGVKYIQDTGTKLVNNVYIDRPTGKLYKCITETASVNNDANFKEHNNEDIYNSLGSLIDINGGESRHLIIKTGQAFSTNGLQNLFSTPFPKKCLIVLAIDNTGVPQLYQQLESWNVAGFVVKSIQISNGTVYTSQDNFYYLAIGY